MKREYDMNFQIMILMLNFGWLSVRKKTNHKINKYKLLVLTHSRNRKIEYRQVPKSKKQKCVCRAMLFLLQN